MKPAGKISANKPRPKRKMTAQPTPPSLSESAPTSLTESAPADHKNVGALESLLSLFAGVLLVIAALFPRSIKQMLFLVLGGGMVYRGMTSKCGLYEAIGFNTVRDSLFNQINARYSAATNETKR